MIIWCMCMHGGEAGCVNQRIEHAHFAPPGDVMDTGLGLKHMLV